MSSLLRKKKMAEALLSNQVGLVSIASAEKLLFGQEELVLNL